MIVLCILIFLEAAACAVPFFSRNRAGQFGVALPFDPVGGSEAMEVHYILFNASTGQGSYNMAPAQAHLEYAASARG